MSTLIRLLEWAGTVWRIIVLVVACLAAFSFYEYKDRERSVLSGNDVARVVDSARDNTNFGFVAAAFDSIDRFFRFTDRKSVGATAHLAVDDHSVDARGNKGSSTVASPAQRGTAAYLETRATEPVGSVENASGRTRERSGSPGHTAASAESNSSGDLDVSDRRVRLAFGRLASQFCRATRAISTYYSERISRPNGVTGIRVGSGVRFPSLERLSGGPQRSLAEKELEVRLRCDYELTYGTGERADPRRPAFEHWREATLERQYGAMWTRIDLSHIPTPDEPMSRGEWYVLAETPQQ